MTGTITTFYSYRGGVGRSFLLANVGVLLAKWGYRVLCVDWDIEAPGLDEYFRPWLTGSRKGITEYAASMREGARLDWHELVYEVPLPGAPLSLITSGISDVSFAERVQAVDWQALYDDYGFGSALEHRSDRNGSDLDRLARGIDNARLV